MAAFNAKIINHYEIWYQAVFSARFDELHEKGEMLDEIELYKNLKINHNLTESDNSFIEFKSQFDHQIQNER